MKKIIAVILSVMMILPFCLAFTASAATPGYIYIDDINTYGSNKIGPILIYGNGVSASDKGVNAHAWWNKVIAAFNAEDGSFVVHTVYSAGAGDTSYMNVKLAANEIMIITHATIPGSHATLGELMVGDKLYAYGFDFTNGNVSDALSSADDNGTSSVCFTTVEPLMGNGYYGYVAPPEPNIKNIGAKVNTELAGIRFGTTFKNDATLGLVVALGTLLIPEAKLGASELTIDSANSLIVNVPARTIAAEDYVEGKAFEDYESFTYYVTIIGLEGHESDNIVARSYVTYSANSGVNTVYADAITRNINQVAAA